jgi:hypothetical protein
MPTVECSRDDCKHIGEYEQICIAKRIELCDGKCMTYELCVKALMQKFNPRCHRERGKYRSYSYTVRK